jgi:hypothetical protein
MTKTIHYAPDSEQPVLNGRGFDIRRIYKVELIIGGVERELWVVACFLNDAYKVFEGVFGLPAPEVIAITSTEYATEFPLSPTNQQL